jgi:hypothetical protein
LARKVRRLGKEQFQAKFVCRRRAALLAMFDEFFLDGLFGVTVSVQVG